MKTLDKLTFMEVAHADYVYLNGEMSDADELFGFMVRRRPDELKEFVYEVLKEGKHNVVRVG
jgi:hypothetical protein